MKTKLELENGRITYEFDDEAEFEGKTFIYFKKISTFKDQKKYQSLTCRTEDREAVFEWLEECINGAGDKEEPF